MKKMNKFVAATVCLSIILSFITSCDSMDDIQRKFTEKEEQIYLGKVDSLKAIPGFGRAKITWYIGSDPKIEKTVIYWNMRQDSIVKDFVRTTSEVQKDSIIIENLPEGSSLYEFRNINSKGESSLYSSVTVPVWGNNFASVLLARKIMAKEFNYSEKIYTLTLSPTVKGDSVVYSQIIYTDNTGTEKNVRIERETNTFELEGFDDGSEFSFRNIFFIPTGLDTVYADYQTVTSPKAIFDQGKKISLGSANSSYFEYTANGLYEWNTSGDLILYQLNENDLFTQSDVYPALAPRNMYREFFFYDDDKFIGVSTGNLLSMHQIDEFRDLVFVKTPAGANTFGSGFSMPKFIPAKGFFYSISAVGALQTWMANNDATFGTPNGSTVGTITYEPLCLFNTKHIVGIDANGYLWSIPISVVGSLGSKSIIGKGWNKFVKLITVGQKLIAVDGDGNFYEFDFNATDLYWVIE